MFVCRRLCRVIACVHVTAPVRPPPSPLLLVLAVANVLIISNTDYLKGLLLLRPLDLFGLNYSWSGAACEYHCCQTMKDYTVNIQPWIFIYVHS